MSEIKTLKFICAVLLLFIYLTLPTFSQSWQKEFALGAKTLIEIENLRGQVKIITNEKLENKMLLLATNAKIAVGESDLTVQFEKNSCKIAPKTDKRLDLTLEIPVRRRVKVKTESGEVQISGNIESAEVFTDTGTIYADVPLDSIKYSFNWTRSKPRFLSEIELTDVKEKSAGRYEIGGNLGEAEKGKRQKAKGKMSEPPALADGLNVENSQESSEEESQSSKTGKKSKGKSKIQNPKSKILELDFTTQRGVILLNVPPSQVPADLRERKLTEAAKGIIRSGDSTLMEAIRKVNPKFFGDYAKTLPPRRRAPNLTNAESGTRKADEVSFVKRVNVSILDKGGRAVSGLKKEDFAIFEKGSEREILDVTPTEAPFNLILLLDVSGSVEDRIDFIRKAARSFLQTSRPEDRISIVTFRDDIQVLTDFTTDRQKLSESLDTFDAGGGTALYDALGYSLAETLQPLKGERTAIVILSDGDDNRSFLPFDALVGAIQETGALIYPLYVPSELIPANGTSDAATTLDPLRTRYLSLTTRSQEEGKKLAEISGGKYYPISALDQIQAAYEDVVAELRTAYSVTFRSNLLEIQADGVSPRLRVQVKRENTFARPVSVQSLSPAEAEKYEPKVEETKTEPQEKPPIFQKINFNQLQINTDEPGFKQKQFPICVYPCSSVVNFPVKPQQPPEITGDITTITYKPLLTNDLKKVSITGFDINSAPPAFILTGGKNEIAISRWVSPKRTRSYPYERVYNTLLQPKKITVIPILKDEGADGERDFLQFDTVSLMNLLDVYVVIGFYNDATRDSGKELTNQKFDNTFILSKIKELETFKGTASEWNLKQLSEISQILEKAKLAYAEISKKTGVRLHDEKGLENFARKINKNLEEFRAFSRQKSQKAQNREFVTTQPKEALSTDTKGRVTMTDQNGGKYFFTCDETLIDGKTLYLIEDKHTIRAKMPNPTDIKDGLLKMMLYASLKNVKVGEMKVESKPVLRLTSSKIEGGISSEMNAEDIDKFFQSNNFNKNQRGFVNKLFEEARLNKIIIKIEKGETAK